MSSAALVTEVGAQAEVVALVNEQDAEVKSTAPSVKVVTICNKNYELRALIYTNSPVSFVKLNVYKKWILPYVKTLKPSDRVFVNIKNEPLNVVGVVPVNLSVDFLENKTIHIDLFVKNMLLIATLFSEENL